MPRVPLSRQRSWTVQGSKPEPYTVTVDGAGWHCTCPSHHHRGGACKHIRQVQEANPDIHVVVTQTSLLDNSQLTE